MFEENFRKASAEDIQYYEKALYPLQDEVFNLLQTDRFYLTGGTCLSRFYYQHRYSEDLDFFFDGFRYPREEYEILFRDFTNRLSESFKTEITVSGDYFKRGFVYKDEAVLKIEFVYENYRVAGEHKEANRIIIDSKENIATNKLTAVYDRKTAKDFFDLYYLLKEIDFEKIAKWAEEKVVPLDYEGVIMAFADQRLDGTVLSKKPVPLKDFNDFVSTLIKRMIDHAQRHT